MHRPSDSAPLFSSFRKLFVIPLSALALAPGALAHCPLCTMGAAAAAGGALWLGVSGNVVALFIGAFAISMGWMIAKMIKKKYVPHQTLAIILLSFLTTVLPIAPLLKTGTPSDYYPILVSIAGGYGSLLNRTYLVSVPLVAAILGGLIVGATPALSGRITRARAGKTLPFQGTILTLAILTAIGIGIQALT